MDKMKMSTPDFTRINVEKIAEMFPNVVTEAKDEQGNLIHKIDFEKLKQELSSDVIDRDESYDFTWVGKKSAMVEANKPTNKTLRPCLEDSVNWDKTENLYIEGDNLEVLKLLQESYLNKIKMIYIDPPYNTGNDSFIYPDDYATERGLYDEEVGAIDESGYRMFKNTENNGRFHSSWCSMMYPRLKLARNLLTDDGVIFISIDDNEVDNLKKMCDEVFGASNFIGLVTREMKKGANRGSQLSPAVDYLLVYAKSLEKLGFFYEPFDKDYIKTFKFDDGDGKGAYKKVNLYEPTLDFYANCRYEIKCPDGEIVITPEGKSFRCNKESFYEDLANNGICFEKKKSMLINSNTGETANWCVYTKLYLKDMLGKGRRPSNLFLDMINANGTKELTKLKLKIFEFSKPVGLIKYLIKIISNTNIENNSSDIILDFFSGSATTAQAVMEVNTELNSNRKFIMIQLPEICNEKSKAYKAGYKNICEIGKERIRRAGKKIVEETGKTDLDIGFRVLKLDESNMKNVYYTPDELSQSDLIDSISNIKEGRSGYDLLYQCMLDWGLELSLPHRMERINNNEVHIVNDGDLIACFDDKIPEETVKQIADLKPLRVVFRDSSFATPAARINVDEIFKLKSPQTTIKVL